MIERTLASPILALLAVAGAIPANAADSRIRGIAIDQNLIASPTVPEFPPTVPGMVRLAVETREFVGPEAETTFEQLREALSRYSDRSVRVIVSLPALPARDADVEPWRLFVRSIAEIGRGKVIGYQIGRVNRGDAPDVTRYVFLVRLEAVQVRSVDDSAVVLEGAVPPGETDWQTRALAAGLGPYVDGFAIDGPDRESEQEFHVAVGRMSALIEAEKPAAIIVLGSIRLSEPAQAREQAIGAVLRYAGTLVHVVAFAGDSPSVRAALTASANVADLVAGDIVTLDERTNNLSLTRNSADVSSSIPHRLLYSLSSFGTYLVYSSPASPVDLDVSVANATTPVVRDPFDGTSRQPGNLRVDAAAGRLQMSLPVTDRQLLVDFNFGAAGGYATRVDVQDQARLRVEEIVFRSQQAQAIQDNAVQRFIAHTRVEQHFHPSPADPAYNLVTENRLFSDHGAVEWEELSFELNGAKWSANRPPFPLVQPEKVLSLPLALRLNQDYTYRLDGTDTVDGRAVYVIRFDPVDAGRALYRGIVWIDRQTFLRLKVQAVETRLTGPVVSNDETQLFLPVGQIAGRDIWLPTRVSSQQVFLIAGRTVLIERIVTVSDVVLNPADFDEARGAARLSDRIMYRETDNGTRYLVKQGDTRVVSDNLTSSARAFALGVDVDPSLDFPLPIGGFNILDFNFLHRNLQFALLYGGVIALGNIQGANIWGGHFDASVDFFGLALKSNDDVFSQTGRLDGQRVNRIPFSTGFNLGFQVTPFQKLIARYEFHYDAYSADAITDPGFVVPSSTGTHGEGAGYEYRRRGYALLANVTAYQRTTWTKWGYPTTPFDPDDKTFTKYDVGLSKDFTFATFHTIHLNGTYFGGERLDRFSMYQFGLFDAARMHGVPSAVRFGDLGMFRGSYSFNLFDQYRLDLFLDHASGHDPANSRQWLQVTGTGVRVNMRTPWNTILQVDYGKSFLPDAYRGAGSNVLQVLLLKPL